MAELYLQFGDGPLGRPLEGCDCCTDPKTLARWAETPLRELAADLLTSYLYSAMSTVGTEEDFKHFLPRLFELAARDPDRMDLEELGAQLYRAGWLGWSEQERSCVQASLEALWDTLSSAEQEDSAIDALVCGVALSHVELPPLLNAWLHSQGPAAKRNLARFIEYNRDSLESKRRLVNAFWDESPAQETLIADWLRNTMGVP